jgi:hypothetical protein
MTVILNGRRVVDIEVDDVDPRDYPDFCDAHFSYAVYEDSGEELTDEELEQLAEEFPGMLSEMAYEYYM